MTHGVRAAGGTKRVTLASAEVPRLAGGRFARVMLPEPAWMPDGALATSVLLGRVGGELRAYANVCRHHPVALDADAESAMADDGYHLLCHAHGALYRPADGVCVNGPCVGASLFRVGIEETGDAIVLTLP